GVLWTELSKKEFRQMLETYKKYEQSVSRGDRVTAGYLAGSAHMELQQHAEANALFSAIHQDAKGTKLHEQILYKKASSEFELGKYDAMNETLHGLFTGYPK